MKEDPMFNKYFKIIGVIAVMLFFSACSQTCLESNWGNSFRAAKSNQILNPDAGNETNPVEGLEGVTASMIHNKYNEGFSKQSSTCSTENTLTLGIVSKNSK